MSALGPMVEREMRGFLRKMVAGGWAGLDSSGSALCWYCGADAEYVKRPNHKADCLYVRAKELLAKYPASHV